MIPAPGIKVHRYRGGRETRPPGGDVPDAEREFHLGRIMGMLRAHADVFYLEGLADRLEARFGQAKRRGGSA